MSSHGLQFAWRISFVDRWTIRLLGKAKPGKTFVSSNCKVGGQRKYVVRTPTSDVTYGSRTELEATADELSKKAKNLTNTLRSLRKEILPLQLNRMDAGRKVRQRLSW